MIDEMREQNPNLVEAHDEGRKAMCIDEINTTIYYKKFSQSHDLSHMLASTTTC